MKKIIIKSFLSILLVLLVFSCKTMEQLKEQRRLDLEREKTLKEIEVGQAVFAKIAGKYGILKNQEATEYLNKFGKSLAFYTERQDIEYFFAILNTEQINAYSLPGGYILISLGALKQVKNPGALAGIIAHELGHINKKHILNNVKIEVRYNFFELLARFLAGPKQIITNLANQISEKVEEQLFIKGFANTDEFEADLYAINLLQALNIGSKNYIDYLKDLQNIGEHKNLENLDATHPKIETRVEKLIEKLDNNINDLKTTQNFINFKKIIDETRIEK
ncbi:MAG: hypothetical protein A2086_16865 [Spirochaetes bacterium GWD1_27_9]|nr:MAG: hypothetical protein A2Z98_08175 [Spirochaetes bacterium GWB1_27_13]OHD20253.1 MAG: hypothetical protein A2Y34_04950 [Spirochaetes bacterium GWC1_27_15]OHD33460.1 MAG: hypothetical protein A2086_16865 [Spirochaetes bacterium GWD1_27_9]